MQLIFFNAKAGKLGMFLQRAYASYDGDVTKAIITENLRDRLNTYTVIDLQKLANDFHISVVPTDFQEEVNHLLQFIVFSL